MEAPLGARRLPGVRSAIHVARRGGATRPRAAGGGGGGAEEAHARPPPPPDYGALLGPGKARPRLLSAPMEGLGDHRFRRALCAVAPPDEACREFIRVPSKLSPGATAEKVGVAVCAKFELDAALGVPSPPQVMGERPDTLRVAARALLAAGAPRVDLNCGCPANCVTGKGAGSSLMRTPERLRDCVDALRAGAEDAGGGSVTVKLRAGFDDDSLFVENVLAAQEGGAAFITVHPRTRKQGYSGNANWDLIALAKQVASVPVVGNGDVTTVERGLQLIRHSNCDGVMIGRGAVQDPLIFARLRAALEGVEFALSAGEEAAEIERFLRAFVCEVEKPPRRRGKQANWTIGPARQKRFKVGKLKSVVNYLFEAHPGLAAAKRSVMHDTSSDVGELLERAVAEVHNHWLGAPQHAVIDTFSARSQYVSGQGSDARRQFEAAAAVARECAVGAL